MRIEYKKLLKGYLVYHKGAILSCDKDRLVALSKALQRVVYKKFNS